jgi:tRNA-dihydrouridine synthase
MVLQEHRSEEGLEMRVPPLDVRFEMLLDHARRFEAACGQEQFRRMRKHLGWYCKGFPHAASLRADMFRVSSVADLEQVLANFHAHGGSFTEASDRMLLSVEPSSAL